MAIRIATWNIEGRLARYDGGKNRGTPEKIVDEIAKLNADIVVLPEAYLNAPAESANAALKKLGYSWHDVAYDMTQHDVDIAAWGSPYFRVLYRIPIVSVEDRRWGNICTAPLLYVDDPETNKRLCVVPIHLDDITEERRLAQVADIITYLKKVDNPVVMLGDFNAMWHENWRRMLTSRMFKRMVQCLPKGELEYALRRLSGMADGRVMARLKNEAGLIDADPRHKPTVTPKKRSMLHMPSIRLMQIDHILIKGMKRGPVLIGKDAGSDHRSVVTTITTP